jgi:uncharacterized repeat protein (TIGR03803 family)
MPVRHAYVRETVLHSFGGYSDGAKPESGLTYFKGRLYGTTNIGGVSCRGIHTCGTVYSITPSGYETVLHRFTGGLDGARPVARMIILNGKLYGTTLQGGGGPNGGPCIQRQGVFGGGTVFSITSSGRETVVHAFTRSRDGLFPQAPLLNVNGIMYGTTCGGGATGGGNGTAFTITPSGYERVIYSFQYSGGAPPSHGRFADLYGRLYGTASGGGTYGYGTVFSLSTSGRERLLHSFRGASYNDGADPEAGLNAVNGTLYGVTARGGYYGDGTVFSISPTGYETVLHSFNGSDGSGPVASLLSVNPTLYGTTENGGAYGYGTVFSITQSGYETVLYSFKGGRDGAYPLGGVIDLNGQLYGTTSAGGVYNSGTVFSLKP